MIQKLRTSLESAKLWGNKNMTALVISHIIWAFVCSMSINLYSDFAWTLQEYFTILLVGLMLVMPTSFFLAQYLIETHRLFEKGVDIFSYQKPKALAPVVIILFATTLIFSIIVRLDFVLIMMIIFPVIAVTGFMTTSLTMFLLEVHKSLSYD